MTRGHQERGYAANNAEKYEDPRNAHLLVYVGAKGVTQGCIVPREMAAVNPWDSAVQGGDAAWEGLRVYRGKILSLEKKWRNYHADFLLQTHFESRKSNKTAKKLSCPQRNMRLKK